MAGGASRPALSGAIMMRYRGVTENFEPSISDAELSTIRALFVSPHFDDVALSCAGTLCQRQAEGDPCLVATVFTEMAEPVSEYAREFNRECGLGPDDTHRLWQLRRQEDRDAAAILNTRFVWLGFVDAIYRGYHSDADLFGVPRPEDRVVAERVASTLVALWAKTAAAVVYVPLAIGEHVDHQLCAGLGATLAAAGACVVFYEDYPYAEAPGALARRLDGLALQRRSVDITSHVSRRIEAVGCYRTQVGYLFPTRSASEFIRDFARSRSPESGRYGEYLYEGAAR
jgi:LmbE family N-acetylglucosaminyl deacetylase